jgi:hypothetical protein
VDAPFTPPSRSSGFRPPREKLTQIAVCSVWSIHEARAYLSPDFIAKSDLNRQENFGFREIRVLPTRNDDSLLIAHSLLG